MNELVNDMKDRAINDSFLKYIWPFVLILIFFFKFNVKNGAKHPPLVLGVWVTESRILEVQPKFVMFSFVTVCSQKINIFIKYERKKVNI